MVPILKRPLSSLAPFVASLAAACHPALAQPSSSDSNRPAIVVQNVKPPTSASGGLFVSYGVTRNDRRQILAEVENIRWAIPVREVPLEVRRGEAVTTVTVTGTTQEYFKAHPLEIERGRAILEGDVKHLRNLVVLGKRAAAVLFPKNEEGQEDPIGKTIRIQNHSYLVVGLLAAERSNGVYIPISTMRARMGDLVFLSRAGSREGADYQLSRIEIVVKDRRKTTSTWLAVRRILHLLYEPSDRSFQVLRK